MTKIPQFSHEIILRTPKTFDMLIYDPRSTQYGFQYINSPFTSYFFNCLRDIACPFGRPGQNPGGEAATQLTYVSAAFFGPVICI